MKFLHLQQALNAAIPKIIPKPTGVRNEPSKPNTSQCKKQRIIKGIARDPVNKQAAIVTSKASWIHHAPIEPMGNTGPVIETRRDDVMKLQGGVLKNPRTGEVIGSVAGMQLDQLQIDHKAYAKAAEEFKEFAKRTEKEFTEYRKAICASIIEFSQEGGTALNELRSLRMPIVIEVGQILPALKELRQFFIGPDHHTEIARLKEFVDLCERLQKLKESGFLDAVTDTMIRLGTAP